MAGRTKRKQQKQQKRFSRPMQGVALAMLANQLFLPMAAQAGPPVIPSYYGKVNLPAVTLNQLPQLKSGGMQSNATVATSGNSMTITQTAPRAIIDWDEFNIGVSASVYFSQKQNGVAQTGWAALNRIYDINPSQIYGSLKADGRIYLLNQNGILFGSGSTVNVHTLVASSLKMDLQKLISTASSAYADDPSNKTSLDIWSNPGQFLDETTSLNLTKFTRESWNGLSNNLHANGGGGIANEGTITSSGTTNEKGGVYLVGGAVENHGTINAPSGQIALAAGTEVYLSTSNSNSGSVDTLRQGALTVKVTGVESGTDALNETTGNLLADQGMVGMYGNRVTQNGLIRSISTVKRNGTIELLAKERVTTGVGSITATPVTDSAESLNRSFLYDTSGNFAYNTWITLAGLDYSSNNGPASLVQGIDVVGIEHLGSVVAPGAKVVMNARDRVFLGNQSLIDVSGSRVDLSVSDKAISTILTSNELRDNQVQKDGLLKGYTVSTNSLSSTSLANLSSLATLQQAVARQWTVNAGSVEINAHKGDIVMKQGATIDISGGVTGYSSGDLGQTALVYGTKVYGLGNAPSNLTYTRLLGSYTKTYDRFGVEEKYKGLSFGGANRLFNPVPAFEEGGNAGKLTMKARQLLLDGQIRSSVTRGLFQTRLDEIRDSSLNALTRGLKMPDGGTLILGDTSYGNEANQFVDGVVITDTAESQTSRVNTYDENKFSTPVGSIATSVISSSKLSLPENALSNLQIYTNSSITTTADSNLALLPGGSVTLRAQQVEHNGSISVPTGKVDISLLDHIKVDGTKVELPTASQVLLASGSSISTAGLQNRDYTDTRSANYVNGGSISVKDLTEQGSGVLVEQGAVLSVDGGYTLDKKGKATAGNAGSLTLAGSSVALQQGTVSGKAMTGKNGGSLSIHSNWMTLANQYRSTASGTVLGTDQLLDSGFGTLDLAGVFGLTVEEGTRLPASLARLGLDGASPRVPVNDVNGLNGSMGLKLTAGKTLDYSGTGYLQGEGIGIQTAAYQALLSVGQGADLTIAPEGSIELSGPGVKIAGTLRSNSGKISVAATGGNEVADHGLTIGSSALLDASGYNKAVVTKLGSAKFFETTPRDGGSISLKSSYGTVSMAQGAVADVSGAAAVAVTVLDNSSLGVGSTTVAGSAGSVTISGAFLDLQGSLQAATHLAGTKGGTLGISTSSDPLTVTGSQIGSYLGAGFDALSFGSNNELILSGSMDQRIGRSLTLDAPLISGTSDSIISLYAPWINLTNSSLFTKTAVNGTAQLNLSANVLDLSGSVALNGFSSSRLSAINDISASEIWPGETYWTGALTTAGDLTLQAARIYPKNYAYVAGEITQITPSEFLIKSSEGSVTFLSSGGPVNGYLDSVGGSLTVEAKNGINQSGTLLAPLGRISLNTTGSNSRVYLAPGSITSTRGGSDAVQVGYLDSDGKLVLNPNNDFSKPVAVNSEEDLANWRGTAAGVFINSDSTSGEVVQADGALIDVSGGGEFFAYKFYPGAAGSVDPLKAGRYYYEGTVQKLGPVNPTKTGSRFVVVPQATAPLGGQTIYLAGGDGVAAGVYTIVPERYAFLPNALVVSDAGGYVAPGESNRSTEGYNIIGGYLSEANTAVSSSRYRGYTVRTASDVLKEGDFTKFKVDAGNGNAVSINGATILLDGTISARAVNGEKYTGGSISLAGANMTVQNSNASTTGGIDFSSAIPSSLKGTVAVSSDALSGQGFKSVTLGSTATTETLTFAEGSNLVVSGDLNLQAKNLVKVETNSSLSGETLTLASPTGTVNVAAGATLTGTKSIDLDVASDMTVEGTLHAPQVNLASNKIQVGGTDTDGALYLSENLWGKLNALNSNIGLKSKTAIVFNSTANDKGVQWMTTAGNLTLDAASLVAGADEVTASVSAQQLYLKNSSPADTAAIKTPGKETKLTLKANTIDVDTHYESISSTGYGNVKFNGFSDVLLDAAHDLVFSGSGTLNSSGNLTMQAQRVTTKASKDLTNQNYLPANVLVQAANTLTINQSTGKAGTSIIPGGALAFKATDIIQAGTVAMQSGTLKFDATKSLTFANGSQTLNQGSATGAGGSIVATATNGALTIADGALLNVSAGSQGDAGSISLIAVTGGVTVGDNTLQGSSTGTGGSFSMDSATFGDTGTLLTTLASGGFTEQINLRARTGDLTVADSLTGDEITARRVSLAADAGKLTLEGQITTGSGKGQVELFADQNLTLAAGSSVTVTGGGAVNLGSSSGTLTLDSGSLLDLSDNSGTVNLRAVQDIDEENGVKMALNGEIKGASEVNVEAVKVYKGVTSIVNITNTRDANYAKDNNIAYWQKNTNDYMANATGYRTNLLSGLTMSNKDAFHFRPGVEAQSSGAMTLGSALDLTGWRYTVNGKSETGVLTLRAAGNLTLTAKLEDKPTTDAELKSETISSALKDSWDFRLVAGANGANPLATAAGSGLLTVTGGAYTEGGNISFASGGDTKLNNATMTSDLSGGTAGPKFTIGSYSGAIRGEVGGTLDLSSGGVLQSATGDIDLTVQKELKLGTGTMGAIRTTGTNGMAARVISLSNDSVKDGFTRVDTTVQVSIGGYQTTLEILADDYNKYAYGYDRILAARLLEKINALINDNHLPFTASINENKIILLPVGNQQVASTVKVTVVGGNLDESTQSLVKAAVESAASSYWFYGNAGDIVVKTGGSISGSLNTGLPWDSVKNINMFSIRRDASGNPVLNSDGYITIDNTVVPTYWGADYTKSGGLKGIAAMAGGNVTVQAGGDIQAPIGSFAPSGSTTSGNLEVASGGNLNGRFMSGNGNALLSSQGSFGTDDNVAVISASNTKAVDVTAQADIWLGTLDNPTIAHSGFKNVWNLTYLPESSLSLTSLTGDLTLTGLDRYYGAQTTEQMRILPASLSMQAAGDIFLQNSFVLAPSATAELNVAAGGDLIGTSTQVSTELVGSRLVMSDLNPDEVYGVQTSSPIAKLTSFSQSHSTKLTAARDTSNPITITVGGDITDLELDLVKQARISVDGNITDLHYVGQNINSGDLSSITAGGRIVLNTAGLQENETSETYLYTGFQQGGPGTFLVAAGSDIDLGGTIGIQTYGNHKNAALAETGSDLFILAGVDKSKSYAAADVATFFHDLKAGAQEYSRIKADTGSDGASKAAAELAAAAKLEELQTNLIKPFLTDENESDLEKRDILDRTSNLNMVSSQISTLAGNSINIMTGDAFNVGKSTFYESSKQKNTGVYTAQGGDINVFSRGDVNVNESRLMTFYGGDITVWSDEGNIYAGRGSKTAINPSQSLKVMRDDGSYITRFSPPSVGSGVRAMTYDSGIDIPTAWDMSNYPDYKSASSIPAYNPDKISPTRPAEGDIALVARLVDAGEAGIYGGKVYIGADTVLNSNNISSSGLSVGVPAQTTTTSLGTLSGSGTLNEGSRMLVESTAMGNKSLVEKVAAADSFVTAWLDVKVLGFEENPPN